MIAGIGLELPDASESLSYAEPVEMEAHLERWAFGCRPARVD